jgi:glutamyl-tRNA reductase
VKEVKPLNTPLTIELAVKADSISETVSMVLSQVEKSRQNELSKALSMMDNLDNRQKKIVNDLTYILIE